MTPREAFKFGFLYRCAEEGLSPEDRQERIKRAADFTKQADPVTSVLSHAPGLMFGGLGVGALASVLAGGTVGAGLAKATEPDLKPEDVRAGEQIALYDLHAKQLRQRDLLRRVRNAAMAGRKPSFNF